MNRKLIVSIFGAVVLAVLIVALSRNRSQTATAQAQSNAPAQPSVSVEVVTPVRQDLTRAFNNVGNVEAWEQATLHAKTAGYLKAIFVDKGDWVRKGQLIAVLDVPEMRQEVEQARAMSQVAVADIQQVIAEYQVALRDYESTRAAVKQPQAELQAAQADLERAKREVAMAERAYEAAQEQSKEPDVALQAAEAELRAAKTQALEPEADIAAAKAQLEAANSDLQAAQAELERCTADVQLYETHYTRYKRLAEGEVVTQQALDEAKAKYDSALATAKAAGAKVGTAQGKVRAAKAMVAAAEARKDTAQERVRSAEAKVTMAQQHIVTAKAQVKTPAAKVDIDKANVAAMERKLETMRAKVDIAQVQVASARAKMEMPRAKQQAAQARLTSAKANIARLTTLTDYAKIEAPFDGVVTERFVDPGAMIQTAASSRQAAPIVTLMNVDKLRIYVDVPDSDVLYVKEGNTATLTVRELPGREFVGRVARFTTALDPGTRTMRVEINVPNPDHTLRAGMYGQVKLALETRPHCLTLPARCLVTEKQKKSVLVVEDGKVKKVEVTIGADDGSNVEITSGLKGNEEVIIRGSGVSPGMAVTAKRVQPASVAEKREY